MAQINLLKNESDNRDLVPQIIFWSTRLLLVAVIALILFYGWIFWQDRKTTAQIPKIRDEISQATKEALNLKERSEFLTRQSQLKELNKLYGGHILLSKLFKALSDVTLKNAQYTSIRADNLGVISANVSVPELTDVDKFLQVFDSTGFNKNFSHVRVSGINKSEKDNRTVYSININMKYNPEIVSSKP